MEADNEAVDGEVPEDEEENVFDEWDRAHGEWLIDPDMGDN